MKAPKSILVIATRRIGDVLLATPLIRSLRAAWPAARIEVLAFRNTEGFLRANPDIDRIITVAERPSLGAHLRLVGSLFRRYDLAVSTLAGDRPTLYAWVAGRRRVGLLEQESRQFWWKRRLLTRWVPFDNLHTHTVAMNLRLADLLGIERRYEVVAAWSAQDEAAVAAALPFDDGSQPFALLHLYPKFPYKMWHRAGWADLGCRLAARGMGVVLTGSNAADELAYIAGIIDLMPQGTVNLAGKLTLAQAACLAARARIYVGPDTALTHTAAALGVPTVALYGPSNPVKWGPWPRGHEQDRNPFEMRGSQRVGNVSLLQGRGDCVPCMEEGCDRHVNSLSRCLQELSADEVMDAVRAMLESPGNPDPAGHSAGAAPVAN